MVSTKSHDGRKIQKAVSKIPNFSQIYEEGQKVIHRSFFRNKNLSTFRSFDDSHHENLSEIFFPDKSKNLEGLHLQTYYDIDMQ